MKKKKILNFFIVVLAVIITMANWTPLYYLVKELKSRDNTSDISFEATKVTVETTGTITSEGGILSLPQTSAIKASVKFLGASVDQDIQVQLGTVTGRYSNAPGSISDPALFIDMGGYDNLAQPIEITIKYASTAAEAEKVPAGLYIDENGNLIPVITKCINKDDGTFTFLTFHASTYTYYILEDIEGYPGAIATDFLPSEDGFSEKNQGSSIFTIGECYGMSSFAKWYFINEKTSSTGGLYDQFQSPQMGVSPKGDVIVPQDIIATKAFQYTTKQSAILWSAERQFSSYVNVDPNGVETFTIDNSVAVRCIMDAIYFWQEPAEVGIYGSAGHSVLAYGYERTASEIYIYIYDPNFPGENNQSIVYDIANKTISTPSYPAGFLDKRLTTTGYGTFSSVSEYGKILEDAQNDFAGSVADVEVLSPVNGVEIAEGTVFMSGTVDTLNQMGEQLGEMIEIVTEGGQIFREYLTKNGNAPSTFDIEIPVKSGENKFLINTIYYDENGNERFLTNDMYGWFIIDSTVAANAIYITLTWDAQPDIDLYVTDPAGDTSYFRDFATEDGGILDIDDTSGFGPEHWTLTTDNTVRWNEPYIVRLHYYTGEGPTSYTISVSANEGTEYEVNETYSGVIYSSDDWNDSPGSGGADWVDICTVIPYTDTQN